ncbi:hypothetical protein BGW42_003752 [Actinomortierella wolfii]|nr:hypothetical protein BGW42_003752 [Actinomortierella wolfii]
MEKKLQEGEAVIITLYPMKCRITARLARKLNQANDNLNRAKDLRVAVDWLNRVVRTNDANFYDYISKLALHTTNPFAQLQGFHGNTSFSGLLSLFASLWVNDHAINGIHCLFTAKYGDGGRRLFVDFEYQTNIDRDQVKNSVATDLFSIVHLEDHWGVIHFNLKDFTISFGDSLGYEIPKAAILNFIHWLVEGDMDGKHQNKWQMAFDALVASDKRFRVDEQPDLSSCGVYAAFAIERYINPQAPWSQYDTADKRRIRYLKLLSGYTTIDNDDIMRSFSPTNDIRGEPEMMDNTHDGQLEMTNIAIDSAIEAPLSPQIESCHVIQPFNPDNNKLSTPDELYELQGKNIALDPAINTSQHHQMEIDCIIQPPNPGSDNLSKTITENDLQEVDVDMTDTTTDSVEDILPHTCHNFKYPYRHQRFSSIQAAIKYLKEWAISEGFQLSIRSTTKTRLSPSKYDLRRIIK